MTAALRSTSLAGRLVLLFVAGSAVIMAGAGYALYHALGMQLEAQDLAEINGKSAIVRHVLSDIDGPDALQENLQRFRDVAVGHPHLRLAVLHEGRWLLSPGDELLARAEEATRSPADTFSVARVGGHTWWLRDIVHRWNGARPGRVDVLVAVDTTHTDELLRDHAAIAIVVAVLGTLASAILALAVVRRGLAPLADVAARAEEVTAEKLGARLDVRGAPDEVRGLADSINRMLERLEESFRMLEQFSADIAHELRTPLNSLLVQMQVTLGRPRTAADYQEALHASLEEVERLQRMVSEMLFMARAERGMIELSSAEFGVEEEAANVVEYFEPAAAEKDLRIELEGSARLRTDRLLFRRALTNLLSNAVRYSPPGSAIGVAIERRGAQVAVVVANPSPDIPPDELHRLFSRFARRDESRTRETEGAGLGLAIVDSIMKALGGSVEARSGGGVLAFTLRFPGAK